VALEAEAVSVLISEKRRGKKPSQEKNRQPEQKEEPRERRQRKI
jgi:hypothetical protein